MVENGPQAAAAAAAAAEAMRVQVIPPPSIDPTTATKESMLREVALLEQSFERRFNFVQAEIDVRLRDLEQLNMQQLAVRDTRIDGIDEATKLRLAGIEGIPAQIDEKVGRLGAVTDERFASIATQFLERDTRSERESRDNKVAVDAAFAAQKEAAAKSDENYQKGFDKSELSTGEKINKLEQLFKTSTDALRDMIDDLKERNARDLLDLRGSISEVAQIANGYGQQKQGGLDSRQAIAWGLAAVLSLITIGTLLFAALKP
jgi:hypothetical protein